MVLTLSPVVSQGVTYPASGDPVLGTLMAQKATASWNYTASITVTPSQVALLASPKVGGIRNVVHLEVTPRNTSQGQPFGYRQDFQDPFFSQSAAAQNAVVTITLPSGSSVQFNSGTTAGLASIASGASVTVTTPYVVPAVAAKGGSESDTDYKTRLAMINGTVLTATAAAHATGPSGPVTAPNQSASTTELLPILGISKDGPSTARAGNTAAYPLTLSNSGGAAASGLVVVDSLPGGSTGTVGTLPPSIAANGNATVSATYTIPATQPAGALTDTASVSWHDARGNLYGPVSSSFNTNVTQSLSGAQLTLAPATAGPNVTGTTQTLTATLVDASSNPVSGMSVNFAVTGANIRTGTATTDGNGHAIFTYTGANNGNDVAQATITALGVNLQSNTSTIGWITPTQVISISTVAGNFYAKPATAGSFLATPADTPAFAQSFPTIDFNPPSGFVNHNVSGVGPGTRPFTDVTTDFQGNYMGTVVAQGNGAQAGVGSMNGFDAVLTSTFVVTKPGDVTLTIYHDDAFILGVGGAASRVSGVYEFVPQPAVTAFNGYNVVGAYNAGGERSDTVTIHFPAAGEYSFELDYAEFGGGDLSLTMAVTSFTQQTSPLSVYVGYADGLRPAGSIFPFPWQGTPGVTFIGGCTFDAGALRFDNSGDTDLTLDKVTVDLGSFQGAPHLDIWPASLVVPAHAILILTQTVCYNFDTSDFSGAGCGGNNNVQPLVNVTQAGVTTTFTDTQQILNTRGFDLACQGNESTPWTRIGGGGTPINVPLPPTAVLTLSPQNAVNDIVGQQQNFTITALDGSGSPISNLLVSLGVHGANTQSTSGNTNLQGVVTLGYTGTNPGNDVVTATAFITGYRAFSSATNVDWTIPLPGGGGCCGSPQQAPPSIATPSPADGTVVTKPLPIRADFTAPAGETIASWKVTYQALDPGPVITLASGTGTPPDPLATLDPTVLPNDSYAITISATASGGGTQSISTSVSVTGNLKPGRFVTAYQDLSVPVGGYQMEVRRAYDSIDKSSGDFGTGWRVDVANFRTSSNRQLGLSGWTVYPTQCFLGLCLYGFKSSVPHFVTVTFPDQHQEVFDFTPTAGAVIFYWEGASQFKARATTGTTSTLAVDGDNSVSYGFDGSLYDASGHIYNPTRFRLTTRDGRILVLDVNRGLVSERDPSGNALTIDTGGVHSTLGPASSPIPGPSITFQRDGQGRITDIFGPLPNQHLRYSYFSSGLNELETFVDATGNSHSYRYDATTGNLALESDANNQPVETLQYDASGRLVSVASGSAPPTVIGTSPDLHQQVFLDPSGNLTTVLVYDDFGDVVEQDQASGGQPALKTVFTYDGAGRMTSVTDPLNHTTSATYDESDTPHNGEQLTVTDAAGRTYTFQGYNSFGQPGSVLQPGGAVLVSFSYDPTTGALISTQRPGQNPTTYQYYDNGLLRSILDPGGRIEQYAYDANGHLYSAADSQGHTVYFNVDAAGNVKSVTDQIGNQTNYSYNGDGSLASVKDADLNTWSFFYDQQGRMKQITDPLTKSTYYGYNSLGQLNQRTDRNGDVTAFTYDMDGNLIKEVRPNNDVVNYGYDALSRLIEADNASSHVDRSYDAAGRLTSESSCANTGSPQTLCAAATAGNQPAVTLNYAWEADGRLRSVASSDAGTIQYGYDPLGRLNAITDPGHGVTGFGYDALSRLDSITRPNGVSDVFRYNASSELISRDSYLGSTLIARADYAIDPVTGRRVSSTNLSGTTNYTYNSNGTLTSATHPTGSGMANESYGYDGANNRTSANGQTSTFGVGDRLQSDGTFNYTYDAEGRLIARAPVGGATGTTYSWDVDGQLTSIGYPNGTSSTYRYDPFGRRVASVDPGGETRYAWNSFSVHSAYGSQNQLQASYVPGPTFGAALEQTAASTTSYYLADGQNNPTAVTDGSGQVVGTYAFNSFGVPQAGNAPSNRYSFGGYQLDSASGLYYAGARYYDPTTGRFLSDDPQPSVNPYPYADNDPVDLVDPLGQQALREYAALVTRAVVNTVAFALRVACVLLNILTLLGLIEFAIDGLTSNAIGALGEDWLGKATGGLGTTGERIPTPGGIRIPDRILRLPGLRIFLESKNAAAIDARSIAQITDMAAEGPVILLTRGSLSQLPRALAPLARNGLLKWVRCFPA
jgi:RHS repeat-associated protein/uncharacterized repeat protein (TIGR01451 family)